MYKNIYSILKQINYDENFLIHQIDIEIIDSILKLNTELTQETLNIINIIQKRLSK